jgi:LPXTG-motif cell wall-anchored protein
LIPGMSTVPEPSSLLLGLAGLGVVGSIGLYRRRRGS